jgi:tRNA-specific 2-thiouridylase
MPDRRARVIFDEPMRDLTPGQAAVMYAGEVVLGLGLIVRAEREPSLEALEAIAARAAPS